MSFNVVRDLSIRALFAALVLLCLRFAAAQSVPAVPSPPHTPGEVELSPQAAYDQAMRPVDIVRRPVANWSEVEQAALSVAKAEAATACAARTPYQYQGEDLLAYARLCAFADSWQPVQQAAMGYLIAENLATPAEKLTGFPGLSMTYDYEVQASLHLKNTSNAFGTAQAMLRTVAYDDLGSEAVNGFARYVQLIQTDQALALLKQRQPILLATLKARDPVAKPAIASAPDDAPRLPSPRSPMPLHDLYADGIMLPALLQFMNRPDEAAKAYEELEATLPPNLSPDDTILIAASRRQYKLLGSPLPQIAASASLLDLAAPNPPDLNRKGAGASALLLFPDWCAQCVAMDSLFTQATAILKGAGFQFYALLAQADPHPPAPPVPPAAKPASRVPARGTTAGRSNAKSAPATVAKPEVPHVEINMAAAVTAAQQLVGTQTLIVSNELLNTFAATDFPLLVVADGNSIVRYIGMAPDNVLVEGGLIFQVAERVTGQWPVSRPKVTVQH